MKPSLSLIASLATMGILLFSCNPESVAPSDATGKPGPAAVLGDPHPALDTVCQSADTMYMIREDDGSPTVNKCFGPAGPIPCALPQQRWGFLEMLEGSLDDSTYIDCNFTLATGWYCDFTNWEFGFGTSYTFDQNGIPIVTSDWGTIVKNPVENKWQVRVNVDVLPNPCYDVALRVTAVRLNLYGAVTPNSSTRLWGENHNWNVQGHPAASNSRWLMRFCPTRCQPQPQNQVDTTIVCKVVYTGLTCTGNNLNCTTLHPTTTDPGAITYTWNTSATTQNLSVCPTATTTYAVGINVDGNLRHVIIYNVNVIDVSCSIPYSGGCGNGGGEIGNGGSTHHPGCSNDHYYNVGCNGGNHQYGCNFTHSGGNTLCNHRGHGYHCTTIHATNRACNGGHTRGCDGRHTTTTTCQTRGGHKYNCTGQHTTGNCNTSLSHTYGCNNTNHNIYRGCYDGHDHHGHGNGSGNGSGYNGGHGHTHVCGGTTPPPPPTLGVKVCHIPPGNPGGAATMCVRYSDLSMHLTGVCPGGCGNNGGGHPDDKLGACNSNPCL